MAFMPNTSDGIYINAEHLKLGSRLLFTLLGHCLTSFFVGPTRVSPRKHDS